MKHCVIKKVVDLSSVRRDYVKNTYPGMIVSDKIDDILNDSEIDAVIISTPVNTHCDLVLKCLANKKTCIG